MTINTHQDLIDAISEAARVQEQAYNEIQRLRADHLAQAQRAAELQAEVDRLTDENDKLYRRYTQQKVYLSMKDHANESMREIISKLNKKIVRLSDKLEETRKDRDRYRLMSNRRGQAIRRMEEGDL